MRITGKRTLRIIAALMMALFVGVAGGVAGGIPACEGAAVYATEAAAPDGSSGASGEQSEGGREIDAATAETRAELYTVGAMITLGAIIVGVREKKNRRR